MTDILVIFLLIAVVVCLVPALGKYLLVIFRDGENGNLNFVEGLIFQFVGIDPALKMQWKNYLRALLGFNGVGLICIFLLKFTSEPNSFDFHDLASIDPIQTLKTSLSDGVENFFSASTGNAALLMFMRGFKGFSSKKASVVFGNFWVDLTRFILFVILPICLLLGLLFLGNPFKNQPMVMSFIQYSVILLIPASAIRMLGVTTGAKKQSWFLIIAMTIIWGAFLLTNKDNFSILGVKIGLYSLLILVFCLVLFVGILFVKMPKSINKKWAFLAILVPFVTVSILTFLPALTLKAMVNKTVVTLSTK
jgi:K+-transporting ATPase A subunit